MNDIHKELGKRKKPDGTIELPVVIAGESSFRDFFGYLPPMAIVDGSCSIEAESELGSLTIKNPRLYNHSDSAPDGWLNLWLEADIAIPCQGRWREYLFLAGAKGKLAGEIWVYPDCCEFNLRAVLENASIKPDLQFSLLVCSNVLSPQTGSAAMLEIMMNLEGVAPMAFATNLFRGKDFWWLQTKFPEGFGAFNVANFFIKLFGLRDSRALLLPQDCSVNQFKLYELRFGVGYTSEKGLSMRHIQAYLETEKPWHLPLDFLTIDYLRLMWQMQWGMNQGNGRPYLLTGQIAVALTLQLPSGLSLSLDGRAQIPDMQIDASLNLRQDRQYCVNELMGVAAGLLPGENPGALTLAELSLSANCRLREMSLYAQLETGSVLHFNLGNLKISLVRLYAGADFGQSGNTYVLGGEIDFGGSSDGTSRHEVESDDRFSLALKGTYVQPRTGTGYWSFRGSLCRGEVSLGMLIRQMLQLEHGSGGQYDIVLSEFDVIYETLNHSFSLAAVFYAQWGSIKDNIPVRTSGKIRLCNISGRNALSVLLALDIPPFMASVQIDEYPSDPTYSFRFAYREHALMAVYKDQVLSAGLENVSLGDIIAFLVELANPNRVVKFPPPWDFLNKIDLSKFTFDYSFKEKSLRVFYRLDLNIIGLFRVNSIGLTYTKDTKVLFCLDTGESGENKAYEWDLLESSTPGMADTQNKFKLHYLAVAQHFSDHEGRLSTMGTIREAVEYLADDSTQMAWSSSTNWLFAADFTINDVFRARAILLDPHLYGITITIDGQKPPFGSFDGLMLELLYKKITRNVGMFRATLILPQKYRHFTVGYAAITIGRMSIELYTNGDFKIDMGFPHNLDFSQSFALEFGIFSGAGGFYFGLLSGLTCPGLPPASGGYYAPVIQLGIGLSIGIGRSFDIGIVSAGFSLQAVGVFEGVMAFYNENSAAVTARSGTDREDIRPVYFRAVAVLGLTGQVHVKVDLFIITLSASVALCAYAQVEYETGMPVLIDLDLELTLQASIKIVFFTIHFEYQLKLHTQICIDGSDTEFQAGRLGSYRGVSRLELSLEILPYISLCRTADGSHEHVLAFLPVMAGSEFQQLIDRMTEWVREYPESGDVDYETICNFLSDNVKITLRVRGEYEAGVDRTYTSDIPGTPYDIPEISGVLFAMPAPVELLVTDEEGGELARREFWKDNMVADSYIELLHKYFSTFDLEEQAETSVFSWNSEKPIAEVVFTDYFNLLLRHITKTLKRDGKDKVSADGLGAMVSRFMLQGLRLPGMGGKNARGLYETLGQQIPFHFEGKGITMTAVCGQEGTEWLNGESRALFTGDQIRSMLPSLNFTWLDRFSVKTMAPFVMAPKSCPVSEQVKLGEKVLYRLHGDISGFKAPVLRLGDSGKEISCDLGVLLPIEIRQTGHDDVFRVIGLDPTDRSKLLTLYEKERKGFRLLYTPAPMDGKADTLMDIDADRNDRFIRQNLTRETQMYADSSVAQDQPVYVTDLEKHDFLRMLWQCSVVCGGYHLLLAPNDKPRIPKNIFDEEGRARLWLLVWSDNKSIVNCIVSKDAADFKETAALFDRMAEDCRPALAPGCFGAEASLYCGNYDGGFSVLSYTAPGISAESRPLVPVESEEDQWRYAPVWPLHRIAGTPNPYDAKPVTFTFHLRDILGNFAAGSVDYTACPETSDFVVGIHEWPGTRLTWQPTKPSLIKVTLSCMEQEKPASPDSLAIVQHALYQTGQKGYSVSVAGHTLDGAKTYLEGLLAYMGNPEKMPVPIELSVFFQPVLEPITNLEFSLMVRRDTETNIERARCAVTQIVPHITHDLTQFAQEFEAAFPGYKLARTGAEPEQLTAIRIGDGGLKVSVAAYERGGLKIPVYYGFRPLCNRPITRECRVKDWDGEYRTQVFADIDIEVWARHLLEDVDLLLSSDFLAFLGQCLGLSALIELKEQLAQTISLQFMPIEENVPDATENQTGLVQSWILEQLRVSLSNGYDISSAAQYRSKLSADRRVRLALNAGGDGDLSVFAGKADTESDIFCVGYRYASRYHTGTFCKFELRAGQLEYNMTDISEGYQRSDWMQFILPLQGQELSLASDIPVPNPLRQIPGKSELVQHTYSPGNGCSLWDYHLRIRTVAAEQDVLHVGIDFKKLQAEKALPHSDDLFDALAQYETVRQRLGQAITEQPDTYLPIFNRCVKDAAERWNMQIQPESLSGGGDTLEIELSMKLEAGKAVFTLSGYDASKWAVDTMQVTEEIRLGEMFEFDIIVKSLPIYIINTARPKMFCTRNSKLLLDLPVNDVFIYKTADNMLPILYAFVENKSISCGEIADLNKENVLKAQTLIADKLGFCSADCLADIVVRYQYGFGRSIIRLPVCMFLSVNIGDFMRRQDIADMIAEWDRKIVPIKENAALEFEFNVVSGERTVAGFTGVKVSLRREN